MQTATLFQLAASVKLSTKTLNLLCIELANGVYKFSLIDLETQKWATGRKQRKRAA
jgi:hypothetical protein